MDGRYSAATPLTSRRHRDAQVVVKARKASAEAAATSSTPRQKSTIANALPLWTCPDCGGAVTNPRHVRCGACIAAYPAQAPEINARRGAAIAARKRALSEWDKGAVFDPELFGREIPAEVRRREALRDRGDGWVLERVRYRHQRGNWTTHVSTWRVRVELVGTSLKDDARRRSGVVLDSSYTSNSSSWGAG
jgi:hypothetical protein